MPLINRDAMEDLAVPSALEENQWHVDAESIKLTRESLTNFSGRVGVSLAYSRHSLACFLNPPPGNHSGIYLRAGI